MSIIFSEKELQVIELYKAGKTRREIAKIVRMSLSTIGSIIEKYEKEVKHKNNLENSIISEETRAIRLFSEGKSPTEVKIELDMPTEEVERLYEDYWKLQGLPQLRQEYENGIKQDLTSFMRLYRITKQSRISSNVMITALRNIKELPLINKSTETKRNELKKLNDQIDTATTKNDDLNRLEKSKKCLLERLDNEIMRLSSKIGRYRRIEKLENDTKWTGGENESEDDKI